MMAEKTNYQEQFLEQMREAQTPLVVFTTNGVQIHGLLEGYDEYVVLMDVSGQRQMVYKHAISTIMTEECFHLRDPRQGQPPRQRRAGYDHRL